MISILRRFESIAISMGSSQMSQFYKRRMTEPLINNFCVDVAETV